MNIQKIFNSNNENILILSTVNCLAQFDVKNGKILAQLVMDKPEAKSLVYGLEKIAIITGNQIIITNQ